MTRLIDADALRAWFSDHSVYDEFPVGYIMGLLDDQPTVDAVRVIRCKDCKYFYKEERYCVLGTVAISDGYCYLGERKEE